METYILAGIAGLGGALAGGAISLISQVVARKWDREDLLLQEKKELYSRMLSVGNTYVSEQAYKDSNRDVGAALLICGKSLRYVLVRYMKNMSLLRGELRVVNDNDDENWDRIVKKYSDDIMNDHNDMEALMREELGIKD